MVAIAILIGFNLLRHLLLSSIYTLTHLQVHDLSCIFFSIYSRILVLIQELRILR